MRRKQIDHPIKVLDLSVRAYNGLKHAGIPNSGHRIALRTESYVELA